MKKEKITIYVLLLSLFISTFLFRLPFVSKPVLNIDEGIYLYITKDIVEGGVPYKTAFDHKGPVMFFLFVPIILIFDNSIIAIRIFTTFYLLISILFVYLISTKLTKEKIISLLSPLIYALFFSIFYYEGLSSNGELFMMLPAIVAVYLYFLGEEKRTILNLFLSGLFSSIAFFIKATSLFSFLVVPLFIIFNNLKFEKKIIKKKIINISYYLAGFSFFFLILFIYFLKTSSFKDFLFSFFIVNTRYVKDVSPLEGLLNLFFFLITTPKYEIITLFTLCCTVFIILNIIKIDEKTTKYFIVLLIIFSYLGVYWGKTMYPHYYLQMALPYSLIITCSVNKIYSLIINKYLPNFAIKFTSSIYIASLFFLFFLNFNILKENLKLSSLDKEIYEVSNFIKENSDKKEKIFILGGEPIIYFLSNRKAPTKYFCWMHHTERFLQILKEIEDHPFESLPKYIIYEKGYTDIRPFFLILKQNYKIEKEIGNSIIFSLITQ